MMTMMMVGGGGGGAVFDACIFWDVEYLSTFTDVLIIGGDVLVVGGSTWMFNCFVNDLGILNQVGTISVFMIR